MVDPDTFGIENEVYILGRPRGSYYAEKKFVEEYGYKHSEVETRAVRHSDPYKQLVICYVSE